MACPVGNFRVPGGSIAIDPRGGAIFIPASPSPNFGLPRTMLNPRQFQFAAKFIF
jgi:hypothetical protein